MCFKIINESFVCRAAPQNVYYTKNFLIDLGKVDVSDITVDGVIYHSQACPSFSKTLKEHFLKRAIVKFEADAGKLCKYAVIKYKSCLEAGHMNSDSGASQQPHGNSKKRKEPYMRIFSSVMKKIESIRSVSAPKKLFSKFRLCQVELLSHLQLWR